MVSMAFLNQSGHLALKKAGFKPLNPERTSLEHERPRFHGPVSEVGRWSIPPDPGEGAFGVPSAGVALPHTACEMRRRLLVSVHT